MDKEDNKKKTRRFTPEELGLKRIVANGRKYIDVTPLWIDSKESQKIQNIIYGEPPSPEDCIRKEANKR